MFFVSKKKYNKMIHQYEEEKKELIRQLNDINDEKTELKLRYDCLKSDRVNTETVLKQNNKLISWIEIILKEFGTINVSTNNPVKIPVISSRESAYMASSWPSSYKEEYIVIPQIEIVKRKYERTNPYGERYFDNIPDNGINYSDNVDS